MIWKNEEPLCRSREVSSVLQRRYKPQQKVCSKRGSAFTCCSVSYKNHFGKEFHYITTNFLNKRFPALLPEFDLWHAIHQTSSYVPIISKTKYLLTIHDLNFIHEKQGP